ncbi:hypothetical protein QVD17_18426 [Tagetes erecta]|uniref:Uncharacterized protein n=1 Tax=Tagetes erecta TaxID=13708 RepID=A0AAD8KL54_TARER|nr:hypothetical protein QVD17_18426 [Tagetes erecta]
MSIAAGVLFPLTGIRLPPWLAGDLMVASSISVVLKNIYIAIFPFIISLKVHIFKVEVWFFKWKVINNFIRDHGYNFAKQEPFVNNPKDSINHSKLNSKGEFNKVHVLLIQK